MGGCTSTRKTNHFHGHNVPNRAVNDGVCIFLTVAGTALLFRSNHGSQAKSGATARHSSRAPVRMFASRLQCL